MPLLPPLRARRLLPALAAPLLSALLACLSTTAWADPNDYVLDLDFTQGEHELEAKLGAASGLRGGGGSAQAAALSWGIGATSQWMTEVYGQFAHPLGDTGTGGFDSVSWENVFRLFEPGEHAVNVGASLEIEKPRLSAEGWNITVGPMLQSDIDQLQVNLNLLALRAAGAVPSVPNQVLYQAQLRYRSEGALDFGVQAFGNLRGSETSSTASAHAHRMGPAIFGSHHLGSGQAISFNVALLFGLSDGAPERTLRAQIEYEY